MANPYDPNSQSQDPQYGQDQFGQPGNQAGQDQYAGAAAQDPTIQQASQDQFSQDPNQFGQGTGTQDPASQQSAQSGQSAPGQQAQNQGTTDQFGNARQQAQNQVDQSIDQFAGQIPGGDQFSQQAKDTANRALQDLESQAEDKAGGLGGLFGGNP